MFNHSTPPAQDRTVLLFLCALLTGTFLLCFHGSNWGRVESWHPDQMALSHLKSGDTYILRPNTFHKPPFHSYLNYFFSKVPNKVIEKILNLSEEERKINTFKFSRILTIVLFLGSVAITFFILKDFFASQAAMILSALLATSAGFVAFAHFLTADIPVLFWMLAAFWFATRILKRHRLSDYMLAGLLTGVATATKYNGLAIGISLVVAHLLRDLPQTMQEWKRSVLNAPLALGMVAVLAGFLLANPYAIIDHDRFIADFLYNYKITPVYGGLSDNTSYLNFLLRGSELFGWPLFVVITFSFCASLFRVYRQGIFSPEGKFVILTLSVFILYYLKFGAFPRMETRFTLPVFPFLLLATAPFWASLRKPTAYVLAVPLLLYGVICSVLVGMRFNDDPRMAAQKWVAQNIDTGSAVEITIHVPKFNRLPSVDIDMIEAPYISVRSRALANMFQNEGTTRLFEANEPDDTARWYSGDRLRERKPDYLAVNSLMYLAFMTDRNAILFPDIVRFFGDLLDERLGYRIVFDQATRPLPWWAFPRNIDFLENRMTILARNGIVK